MNNKGTNTTAGAIEMILPLLMVSATVIAFKITSSLFTLQSVGSFVGYGFVWVILEVLLFGICALLASAIAKIVGID